MRITYGLAVGGHFEGLLGGDEGEKGISVVLLRRGWPRTKVQRKYKTLKEDNYEEGERSKTRERWREQEQVKYVFSWLRT